MDKNEKDNHDKAAIVAPEEEISAETFSRVQTFFNNFGTLGIVPPDCNTKDFYSHLIRSIISVQSTQRGKISCIISIKPAVANVYGGMHGGAVAAVAELVSIACARTVVGKDKQLFLGELSMSYLSAAPLNAEVVVDASVVRSGRNLSVVSVEFRLVKDLKKLVYTSRATFYHMLVASL